MHRPELQGKHKDGAGQNKGNLAEHFPGLLVCGGGGRMEEKGREEGGEDAGSVLKLEEALQPQGGFISFCFVESLKVHLLQLSSSFGCYAYYL